MYKTAIVGLGHVARHQISAIGESDSFELVAGCDTDSSAFSGLHQSMRTYSDLEHMLADAEPDVVIIASPNRLHVAHGIAVMEAGSLLVMEKPLAESQSEFAEFASKRTELGGFCYVSLHALFGLEMQWLLNDVEATELDLSTISRIDAKFYDPYFDSGVLLKQAHSLGGSWLDSGINALSIICNFVDPNKLRIVDSRLTRIQGCACTEVQGTVEFQGEMTSGFCDIVVDTNWTLNRNSKSTVIHFGPNKQRLTLDHSAQQVILSDGHDNEVLFAPRNSLPRLTNHYIGVLTDLKAKLAIGTDNFEFASQLHDLLYGAQEMAS